MRIGATLCSGRGSAAGARWPCLPGKARSAPAGRGHPRNRPRWPCLPAEAVPRDQASAAMLQPCQRGLSGPPRARLVDVPKSRAHGSSMCCNSYAWHAHDSTDGPACFTHALPVSVTLCVLMWRHFKEARLADHHSCMVDRRASGIPMVPNVAVTL